MDIREVNGLADVRGVDRVNRRGWEIAYDDIFPASVLDREPGTEAELRDRLEAIQSWTGTAVVAVEEADAVGDGLTEGGATASDGSGGSFASVDATAGDVAGEGAADLEGTARAEDERVLGYAFARWGDATKSFVDSDDAGLKEIYVDPDYWNEGVGSALLDHVETRVPADYAGLTLSMLAGNERGRRFYERRGFVEVGETTAELDGETYDCVLFRKPL